MLRPHLINGGKHSDNRGVISFVNDFDMEGVKRSYYIKPNTINDLRAWQGHKFESKWFYCIKGAFDLGLVKIDNCSNPSSRLPVEKYILTEDRSDILFVPPCYVNGFRSTSAESILIVYSDFDLKNSIEDDFRFKSSFWSL